MRILGIETSADDTGIALIDSEGEGDSFHFTVLANERISQSIHKEYGGIYPNLAKNEHAKYLPELIESGLKKGPPDVVAVTVGPGLEPCLWTGINAAQALAKDLIIQIAPVNHMEGHILISTMDFSNNPYSSVLQKTAIRISPQLSFPAIALLISGGHTELILMKKFGSYEYLGRTRDDAVGEAFDKVARTLGLPYPGGPEISRLAHSSGKYGSQTTVSLPRPMMHDKSYDFSFSGLKTAVERLIKSKGPTFGNSSRSDLEKFKQEVAREFEDAVTDVLVYKTLRAVEEYGVSTVVMGGGVSANQHIRSELSSKLQAAGCKLLVCPPEYSTDNGLMIALAGYFRALKKEFANADDLLAQGALTLAP